MSAVLDAVVDWREIETDFGVELRPFVVEEDGTETSPVWCPQPGSQEAFLQCPVEEVLYEGTRGPGKTDALLMDFAQHCGLGYGSEWRGILFRRTYPQLSDVIVKSEKWFPRIFPGARYNSSSHVWTWPTGETLTFAYGDKERDYYNYHGKSWPWMCFEELTTWSDPKFFLKMFSCVRSTVPGMPRKIRASTNPYGPGHNWVKMRYGLPVPPGEIYGYLIEDEGMHERMAIHGYLDENQILLTADPGYKDRIRASAKGNKAQLLAWLEGCWDIVAGGMFDDVWDGSKHVVPTFSVPHSWRIYRAFDWGSSAPFSVGWWAESDGSDIKLPNGKICSTVKGDLFRIGEWYGWNGEPNEGVRMVDKDIAKGIIARELVMGIHERCKAGPADRSIWDDENGVCIARNMMQPIFVDGVKRRISFVPCNKKAGSRKAGWELMRQRLMSAAPENPGPREHPGLFVFPHCEQFRRTVPVLPRDLEKDPDDVDSSTEDHIGDETRYMVMFAGWRPKPARAKGVAS